MLPVIIWPIATSMVTLMLMSIVSSRPSNDHFNHHHLAVPGFSPLEKMLTASNGKNPLLAATYYFNPGSLLDETILGGGQGDTILPFGDRAGTSGGQSSDRDRVTLTNGRNRNGHHLKIHQTNDQSNNDLSSSIDDNGSSGGQDVNDLAELGSGYCISADDRKGICYSSNECTSRGGIPMGSCGDANSTPGSPRGAVCCIFEVSCGDESSEPLVYIQNPDFPRATNKGRSNMCRIKIGKSNKNSICQFKLDFINFNIAPPLIGSGNCSNDVFVVTGQNENNIIPKICGSNDGHHYYFAVDESGVITFNFMLNYNHYYHERKFNLQLTQIPCSIEKLKAPPNCLQYLTGTYGSVKSFNYQGVGQPAFGGSSFQPKGRNAISSGELSNSGYPNDLDYTICFKKEPGFCSITYELATTSDNRLAPFEIGSLEGGSTLTGTSSSQHKVIPSFSHSSINSLLSTRSANRDTSKFNVLSNNHNGSHVTLAPSSSSTSSSTSTTSTSSTGSGIGLTLGTLGSTSSSSASTLPLLPLTLSSASTTVIASQCTEDYLIVGGGIRLCSASIPYLPLSPVSPQTEVHSLSTGTLSDIALSGSIGKFDLQSNVLLTNNNNGTSPIVLYTDSTSGPFALRFVSNSLGNARGFYLIYRQNPCN